MFKLNIFDLRLDLGIRQLKTEWKGFFSKKNLLADLSAGAVVACIAIPLSLAIALASGVEPEVGLITAIVTGIVCALFGGSSLSVSGPAAAMAVLIAAAVQEYGLGGLLVITLCCGVLQFLIGILGLGKLARFVPIPVIAGFTAGIGAIILIGQLPRALGLAPPDEAHVFKVIIHVMTYIQEAHSVAIWLTLGTLLITFILPRLFPRLPAPLLAVVIPSLIAYYFNLPAEVIGNIPHTLPWPKIPSFTNIDFTDLIDTILVVTILASLETLLSTSAVDKLTKSKPHNPSQELIGQGLGNIMSSLFGGIPATGVIARSALNVQAGAKTRRAAIFHALFLLLAVYLFANWMNKIPVAVLAGILISVALRMCHPREFLMFWHISRIEAVIYLVTFITILVMGLIVGIQAGIVAALLIAIARLTQVHTRFRSGTHGPSFMTINGPLTFLSLQKIEDCQNHLGDVDPEKGLVIDLSHVSMIDSSGAERLVKFVQDTRAKNIPIALYSLSETCQKMLLSEEHSVEISSLFAKDDDEILTVLKQSNSRYYIDRLSYGVEKFTHRLKGEHKALFEKLASVQDPHTLFITCADSRINPNFITSTKPGELFVIRNMGNIVSVFDPETPSAEGAAVEYTVSVLNVKDIVICGHSGCGAIRELLSSEIRNQMYLPSLVKWLEKMQIIKKQLSECHTADESARLNAVLQMKNIKTYPIIREKLTQGNLRLRAWFYDIGNSTLEEWDETNNTYKTIASDDTYTAVEDQDLLKERVAAGVQYQAPY